MKSGSAPTRLRQLRESRGLSIADVAGRLGTTTQQIGHLELGKRQLTLKWLLALGEALQCHPAEIISELPPGLSEAEQEFLRVFRLLPGDDQAELLAALKAKVEPTDDRLRSG